MNENEERKAMCILLRLVGVVSLVFCFSMPAFAGWNMYKQASIRCKEKNTLRFDKNSGDQIQELFILKRKTKGVFALFF